jgi:hypothetical protein
MAWYVIVLVNPKDTKGEGRAEVKQFANAAAYQSAVGAAPDSVLPAGWQTSAGFPNQLEAQSVANKYNQLPLSQRQAGSGTPLAPSAGQFGTQALANPLDALKYMANFFNALTQPQTWLRVAEVLVGGMLVYVALKATMTPGGVPVASRKASHTFKDTGKKLAKLAIEK